MAQRAWLPVVALLLVAGVVVAMWAATSNSAVHLDDVSGWLAQHRHAWYAPPSVICLFVILGFGLIPVLLLVAATGITFGPVLGPIYAMAGCLTSASVGFALGRRIGIRRVEAFGGERITRVTDTLKRNGTLAVFLLRKIPAPFLLSNIVAGASTVRYRDFMLGTMLGMSAAVIGLAGFGHQLTTVWHDPTPSALVTASLFVAVPLTFAWLINRALRERESTA